MSAPPGRATAAPDRRRDADESVAVRFTRGMNATPVRWGVLADIPFAAVASGLIVVAGLAVGARASDPGPVRTLTLVLAAVPVLVAAAASFALRGSRARVVDWLATLPFPVENLNALLSGLGDTLDVVFAPGSGPLPDRDELQPLLDAVSDDAVLVRQSPEHRSIEIRLGIIDSRRNPHGTNHRRWLRLQAVLAGVLVPLSARRPIEKVLIV